MSPLAEIRQWLGEENPDYLLIYPSVVDGLLRDRDGGNLELPALREEPVS